MQHCRMVPESFPLPPSPLSPSYLPHPYGGICVLTGKDTRPASEYGDVIICCWRHIRFPAAGFTKLLFSGAVAVNDKNNRLGKAGSELTFTLLCPDGDVLWKSKPLIETGTEDRAERIDVTGMATITLQVEASGNNHCAQSVWVDPIIEAS